MEILDSLLGLSQDSQLSTQKPPSTRRFQSVAIFFLKLTRRKVTRRALSLFQHSKTFSLHCWLYWKVLSNVITQTISGEMNWHENDRTKLFASSTKSHETLSLSLAFQLRQSKRFSENSNSSLHQLCVILRSGGNLYKLKYIDCVRSYVFEQRLKLTTYKIVNKFHKTKKSSNINMRVVWVGTSGSECCAHWKYYRKAV